MPKVSAPNCLKLLVPALIAALVTLAPSSSASPAAPRVAVLVHGYLGFNVLGAGNTCTPRATLYAPSTPNEWGKVADTLRGAGWRVYFAHWRTGPASSSSVAEAATCLAAQIAQVKRDENAGRVTLVTHSMGGLVARAYFEGGTARSDVERLITFGAPHLGVNFQQFLKLASLFKLLDRSFDRTANELSFEGMRAFNASHPRNPQTNYHLVGGTHEGWSSFIMNPDGRIPNDGLMYTASALGLRDTGVGRFNVDDVHADFLRKPFDQAREYVISENSLNCLRAFLALAGRRTCQPAPTAPGLAAADPLTTDPTTAFGPTLAGDLAPGETRTLPIVLGGEATVVVSWRGAAQAWLRSPAGEIISPSAHQTLTQSEVAHDSAQTLALFALPADAHPGLWQLHVAAGPDSAARFVAFGTFGSPAYLQLEVPASVRPGRLFSLTATLDSTGQPLDGAAVVADLITGDTHHAARLAPLGEGRYAGALVAPFSPATLRVLATGRTPDGLPFEQESAVPLLVSPIPAYLPRTTR